MGGPLLLSVLFHALLFSLSVGGQGFGFPGLDLPWREKRFQADDLHLVLLPAPVTAMEPAWIAPLENLKIPTLVKPRPRQKPATTTVAVKAHAPERAPMKVPAPAMPAPALMALEQSDATSLVVPVAPMVPTPVIAPAPSASSPKIVVSTDTSDTAQQQAIPKLREQVPDLAKIELENLDKAKQQAEHLEAARNEAARVEAERLQRERQQTALQDATRQEVERVEAARLLAEHQEELRQEAARQEVLRVHSAQQEAARKEAVLLEAQRLQAEHREAIHLEATRQEAVRVETARREAARKEAAQVEAARLQTERQAAALQEATRQEAERVAAARLRAERQEVARRVAVRQEAERIEAERREAAKNEAAQLEASRQEAGRQEMARQEKTRQPTEREQQEARREAVLRAIGQQLNEEADRRDAASLAARASSMASPTTSSARRGRLFGRTDSNGELILYAEAWSRKIQLNMTFDMVRDAAKQSHTNPLVTVALRSDGSVESVTFVLSSGVAAIDEAIRRIVQSQAPYPRFSPALAREFDVIEIRRTWSFDMAVRLH